MKKIRLYISNKLAMLLGWRHFSSITSMISMALYALCLCFDAYYLQVRPQFDEIGSPGWALLLIGWVGLFLGEFSWFANPALCLAWVMMFNKQAGRSLIAASIALAFMMLFLLSKYEVHIEGPAKRIIGYGPGYYLWLASAVTQMIASFAAYRSARRLVSAKQKI